MTPVHFSKTNLQCVVCSKVKPSHKSSTNPAEVTCAECMQHADYRYAMSRMLSSINVKESKT